MAKRFDDRVWAMESAMLSRVRALANASLDGEPVGVIRASLDTADGVAVIPIHGVLLREVPAFLSFFGIDATSYSAIEEQITRAEQDSAIESILFHIDSHGGEVSGLDAVARAIADAMKPTTAYVEAHAHSAAYWLASQADSITAGQHALVGSIGILRVFEDSSAAAEAAGVKVHVVRSGPHKGMGEPGDTITEDQLATEQETVNTLAADFERAVKAGRKTLKPEADIMSGRSWLAEEAKALGLVDGIGRYSDTLAGATPAEMRRRRMAHEQEAALQAQAATDEAVGKAMAAERERVSALTQTFPNDPAFAVEHAAKGSTVEAAKAAYADVLEARLTAAATRVQELEAAAAKKAETKTETKAEAKGAAPVPHGDAGDGNTIDFLAASRALAAEKNITRTEAMRIMAKEQPELHREFIEAARG